MSGHRNETFEWESEIGTASETNSLLSTGIDVLDRKLGGGIPRGKVIALSALPASQSELLLYKMSAVRETVYLTTERRETAVETSLRHNEPSIAEIEIHRLPADKPFEEGRNALEGLSEQSMIVIDPTNPLEQQDPHEYRAFSNDVKAHVTEHESLALLHCLAGEQVPAQRDRTEYLADIIFSLNTTLRGDSIENTLSIPKFRGGRALPEAIDLDLTADVTIDVSRKIA